MNCVQPMSLTHSDMPQKTSDVTSLRSYVC